MFTSPPAALVDAPEDKLSMPPVPLALFPTMTDIEPA